MASRSGKIVAVCTACDSIDGVKTGVWLHELAAPYYEWTNAGYDVTVVSPKGGQVPIDPKSTQDPYLTTHTTRFLKDSDAMHCLKNTPPISDVDIYDHDVIYIAGGHGIMMDGPKDATLHKKIEEAWKHGKIVSAVCHGPAALVGPMVDGKPLVDGKELTSFSNSEEQSMSLHEKVPFLLEDRLKELGAKYKKGEDWQAFVVKDGQLITGQNPNSSEKLAACVLETIKPSVR